MVKKGFNMVLKGLLRLDGLKTKGFNDSCWVAPSKNKKSYGGEPSEKKMAFFNMVAIFFPCIAATDHANGGSKYLSKPFLSVFLTFFCSMGQGWGHGRLGGTGPQPWPIEQKKKFDFKFIFYVVVFSGPKCLSVWPLDKYYVR